MAMRCLLYSGGMDSTLSAIDLIQASMAFDLLLIADNPPQSGCRSIPIRHIVENVGPFLAKDIDKRLVIYGSPFDYKSFYSLNALGSQPDNTPARNLYYMFIAASLGYDHIYISIQKGETSYPLDRNPEMLEQWANILSCAFDRPITVYTLGIGFTKSQYLQHICSLYEGDKAVFKQQIEETVSCYNPYIDTTIDKQFISCGACSACVRRAIALLLSDIWTIEEINTQFNISPLTESRLEEYYNSNPNRASERQAEITAAQLRIRPSLDVKSLEPSKSYKPFPEISEDGFFRYDPDVHDIQLIEHDFNKTIKYSYVFNIISSGGEEIYHLLDSIKEHFRSSCLTSQPSFLIQIVLNKHPFMASSLFECFKVDLNRELQGCSIHYLLYDTSDHLTLPDCRNHMIESGLNCCDKNTTMIFCDPDVVFNEDITTYSLYHEDITVHDYGRYRMEVRDDQEFIIRGEGTVPYGSGYFMAIKVSSLIDYNLRFDNRFSFWCEDYDFILQCHDHEFSISTLSHSSLTHKKHAEQKYNPWIYTLSNIQNAQKKLYDKWSKYFQ